MKTRSLSFPLLASALAAQALRFDVTQVHRTNMHKRSGVGKLSMSNAGVLSATSGDDGLDLTTVHDLIYLASITVGGNDYPVQLDTGSSDLWIKAPTTPLPNSNPTSETHNLTYGRGWAFGHLSYAPVKIAGISIPSQAFLDVSSADNPALSYGADGILGLGFTSLSALDSAVNKTGASTGRSVLYNAFADNPAEPNFLAFALQRTQGPSGGVTGSFAIGEYEPQYKAVADSPRLATWPPVAPTRWNVLLESFVVNNQTTFVKTTVSGAPSDHAVVLLDSGTSYTYTTPEVCQAIYGGVTGAKFDPDLGQWVVPCDAEIDMALQFGGQLYPIHPLDVSPNSLSDSKSCVGSFVPSTISVGAGEFDWLIGDNVLRSMYSVYDFGDFDKSNNMGAPYVQLLSVVDPNQGSADFAATRGSVARTGIGYSPSNITTTTASSTGGSASGSGGGTTVTVSNDITNVLDTFGKFLPVIAIIMAVNTLLLVGLLAVGIMLLVRWRSRKNGKGARPRDRLGRSSLTPMPIETGINSSTRMETFTPPSDHVYEPVSMAMTEDTLFVPPSPGYKKDSDGSKKMRSSLAPASRMSVMYPPLAEGGSIDGESDMEPASPPSRGFEKPKIVLSTEASQVPNGPPSNPFSLTANSPYGRRDSNASSKRSVETGRAPSPAFRRVDAPEVDLLQDGDAITPVNKEMQSAPSSPQSTSPTNEDRPVGVSLTDGPMERTSPIDPGNMDLGEVNPAQAMMPPTAPFRRFERPAGDRPTSVASQMAVPSPPFASTNARPNSLVDPRGRVVPLTNVPRRIRPVDASIDRPRSEFVPGPGAEQPAASLAGFRRMEGSPLASIDRPRSEFVPGPGGPPNTAAPAERSSPPGHKPLQLAAPNAPFLRRPMGNGSSMADRPVSEYAHNSEQLAPPSAPFRRGTGGPSGGDRPVSLA